MVNDDPTIATRMQRFHERILQDRGIQPAVSAQDESSNVDDWNGSNWRNFDKWNDAPIFALKRRKAQVG